MSTREEEIKVKVTGADSAERDLDKLGGTAKEVGDSVIGMGRESEKASKKVDGLGDEAKGAAADLSRLDRQAAETRASMAALNAEFERTGDAKIGDELDKQSAALGKLETRSKAVAKINKQIADDAKRAAKRDLEETVRVARVETRNRRGVFRNTLGDLVGLGTGAVKDGVGTISDATSKIPGASLAKVGLAVAAAPGAGGAIGGAALAGGALLGVGAGVAGAIANNPEPFRKAWAEAVEDVSKRWQAASAGFEKPSLAAFAAIKKAVDAADIEGPLQAASKYVEPLGRGIAGFIGPLTKGIGILVEKAGPVVAVLEKDLPLLGRAFEEAFGDIGDSADGASTALDDIIRLIGISVIAVGKFAGAMSDVYEWSQNVFGDSNAEKVQVFGRAIDGASTSTANLADVEKLLQKAADDANKAVEDQLELFLKQGRAADAAVVAVDDFKKSLDENGGALDGNSKKALENRDALYDAVDAYDAVRLAAITAGKDSAEATRDANLAFLTHLEELRAVAKAHGANTAEIDKYITEFKKAAGLTVDNYIRIHYRSDGLPANLASRYGGSDEYAAGGNVKRTGFALVGENGPEIAWMSQGQYVSTAQQTRALLGGSGAPMGGQTSGSGGLSLSVAPGADSYVGTLIQRLFDAGMIQVFANGQPVTTRR